MTTSNLSPSCQPLASNTGGQLQPTSRPSAVLLAVAYMSLHCAASATWALPTVIEAQHFTDRFGPNTLPALLGSLPAGFAGDKVQVYAVIQSDDPAGYASISVDMVQAGSTISMDVIPTQSPPAGYYGYYKIIDFDPTLMNSWEIRPADVGGMGPSYQTTPIAEPEFLPLIEQVTLQGATIGAGVGWMLPDLSDFDADVMYVRIIDATNRVDAWQSNLLPVQSGSLAAPAGLLQVGNEYAYMVGIVDLENGFIENSSKSFSRNFFFGVPGDLNLDGAVDGADFLDWQRGNSPEPFSASDLETWKAHFGGPKGSSGSKAAPEPEGLALMVIALLAQCSMRRDARRHIKDPWSQRRD
jgi:hypothetical protein